LFDEKMIPIEKNVCNQFLVPLEAFGIKNILKGLGILSHQFTKTNMLWYILMIMQTIFPTLKGKRI
jgi:hypothetical protein